MASICVEMGKKNVLLQGIVEAEETYIWDKSRKDNDREETEQRKRGSGTTKEAVLGTVERGGKVIAQLVPNLTGKTILEFINKSVQTDGIELITDHFSDYNEIG